MGGKKRIKASRHIVWSTVEIDLNDLFQRRWYIRNVLLHGFTEDIRTLDLNEAARLMDNLDLPPKVYHLWKEFFEKKKQHVER